MSTQVFLFCSRPKCFAGAYGRCAVGDARAAAGAAASAEEKAKWRERKAARAEQPNSPQGQADTQANTAAQGRKAQVKVRVGDEFELRPVRIGVSNRVHAEVLEGLEEGTQVVSGSALEASKTPASSPLGGMGGGFGGRRP